MNKVSNKVNECSEYLSKPELVEHNSNTIRRKPKKKEVSKTTKSFTRNDSHADSKGSVQSSLENKIDETSQRNYQGCYEVNHPSLIAAFQQQANSRKDPHIHLQVKTTSRCLT